MRGVLKQICKMRAAGEKQLAALIDPDKFDVRHAKEYFARLPETLTYIFIGGSTVAAGHTKTCVAAVRECTNLPLVLFPGDASQVSPGADALLFLSLLSGRNPEYLIGQQIKAALHLKHTNLEIIPTAYLLIDGGKETAVQRVTQTLPMPQDDVDAIVATALAGKYSGKQLLYLEAGSGADYHVRPEVISRVKEEVDLPLIVGGGIRSPQQLQAVYDAGADLVVIGTAFEESGFSTTDSEITRLPFRLNP